MHFPQATTSAYTVNFHNLMARTEAIATNTGILKAIDPGKGRRSEITDAAWRRKGSDVQQQTRSALVRSKRQNV